MSIFFYFCVFWGIVGTLHCVGDIVVLNNYLMNKWKNEVMYIWNTEGAQFMFVFVQSNVLSFTFTIV